jgi:ABC-type transport system involved in multi-copper enzyme maturation permease subunit
VLAGILQSRTAAAREYERETIKELLLSPARGAIIAGKVIAVAINVAIYLFFLSGGIGVLAFEPIWLQNIAAFVPLTYGRHALEQAVFYSASDQFVRDVAVLALSTLVAVGLGIFSMRRGITS